MPTQLLVGFSELSTVPECFSINARITRHVSLFYLNVKCLFLPGKFPKPIHPPPRKFNIDPAKNGSSGENFRGGVSFGFPIFVGQKHGLAAVCFNYAPWTSLHLSQGTWLTTPAPSQHFGGGEFRLFWLVMSSSRMKKMTAKGEGG